MAIGQMIADQIGRRAFFMMGAKDLVAGERTLTFRIGRNENGVSHVRVTLDASDTYSLEFLRVRGRAPIRTVSQTEGIYCDQLKAAIESGTGLRLSL